MNMFMSFLTKLESVVPEHKSLFEAVRTQYEAIVSRYDRDAYLATVNAFRKFEEQYEKFQESLSDPKIYNPMFNARGAFQKFRFGVDSLIDRFEAFTETPNANTIAAMNGILDKIGEYIMSAMNCEEAYPEWHDHETVNVGVSDELAEIAKNADNGLNTLLFAIMDVKRAAGNNARIKPQTIRRPDDQVEPAKEDVAVEPVPEKKAEIDYVHYPYLACNRPSDIMYPGKIMDAYKSAREKLEKTNESGVIFIIPEDKRTMNFVNYVKNRIKERTGIEDIDDSPVIINMIHNEDIKGTDYSFAVYLLTMYDDGSDHIAIQKLKSKMYFIADDIVTHAKKLYEPGEYTVYQAGGIQGEGLRKATNDTTRRQEKEADYRWVAREAKAERPMTIRMATGITNSDMRDGALNTNVLAICRLVANWMNNTSLAELHEANAETVKKVLAAYTRRGEAEAKLVDYIATNIAGKIRAFANEQYA